MTINTHKGLFRYTRLSFGVASAPFIFQKNMDQIPQEVPGSICFIDDICITGENNEDHLKNLRIVLSKLKAHRSKCVK